MILKYEIQDNTLKKLNPTDYPSHLQDNIVLQFEDKGGVINDRSYAYVKTHDNVKRVKIVKNGNLCACELPPFVTHNTFFKLKVLSLQGRQQMITNEVIVPIRVNDYLDYERTLAHVFPKPKRAIDDEALYYASSDWDIASEGITESKLQSMLTDRFGNKLDELEGLDDKLSDKADKKHKHKHTDVTDWDDEIDEDFDLFLLNITDKIREI